MNTLLIGLTTAAEWQCAHAAAGETWWHGEGEAHVYEFEGPGGETITLEAVREGDTVTVRPMEVNDE